ncbi:MAG: alpha/beta-type small acid-soluble spore protein [Clostridiales bacterium]|nr:alpha/beta-type small acid-soluble spore protein [Clostridiales bacterium]
MASRNSNKKNPGLQNLKNQVSSEFGVTFGEYSGDLTAKQCGSVGGEMVKRMIESYAGKNQ